MHAIELLLAQHREMEAALRRISAAPSSERPALLPAIADELMCHVLAEEKLFYPAVLAKRTEDILLESLEEHLSLKRVLADLVDLPAGSDKLFEAKLHVLREQAEHHHKEEENHLFPKVRKLLDDAALEQLGADMERFQAELIRTGPRKRAAEQTDRSATL